MILHSDPYSCRIVQLTGGRVGGANAAALRLSFSFGLPASCCVVCNVVISTIGI